MTAPKPWPEGAREAVARALRRKITGLEVVRWQAWLPETDAALAALAPWVAEIEAAAFKRGAEAMRKSVVEAADEERREWLAAVGSTPVALGCVHVRERVKRLPIPKDDKP